MGMELGLGQFGVLEGHLAQRHERQPAQVPAGFLQAGRLQDAEHARAGGLASPA
jgi:hypothetical protein